MDVLDALWLGLVQALTEFLPVSSSGHLRLAQALLDAEAPHDLLFDVLLHVGTLVAVIGVYRKDIWLLVRDALEALRTRQLQESEGVRTLLLLVIATVPTGLMGVLLKDWMTSPAIGTRAVGGLLLANGVVLIVSGRVKEQTPAQRPWSVAGIGPLQALVIGVAQGVAILPGISRSGMTIVTALLLGAERMHAARFSFLLSIPAILGALVLGLDDLLASEGAQASPAIYGVGAAVSAVVGALALTLLLKLLRAARFHHFAWYCWALGLTALLWPS